MAFLFLANITSALRLVDHCAHAIPICWVSSQLYILYCVRRNTYTGQIFNYFYSFPVCFPWEKRKIFIPVEQVVPSRVHPKQGSENNFGKAASPAKELIYLPH